MSLSTTGVHISVFSDLLRTLRGKLTREESTRMTTRHVYNKYVIPLLNGKKVSLCDYMKENDPSFVGEANVYIIHAWNGSFDYLVDSLHSHFKNKLSSKSLSSSNLFVWFDVFSVNQYSLFDRFDVDWWRQLKTLIKEIGHTVLILCPWDRPNEKHFPLQRTWCLYELYCVAQSKAIFEVAMPKRHKNRFIKALYSNYEAIDKMINKIDITVSKSALASDKDRIIDFVKKMDGLEKLNKEVYILLKEWLIQRIKNAMILKELTTPEQYLVVKITLGRILRSQERYDEAEYIFFECLNGEETQQLMKDQPHHKLMIMNNLGYIYKKQLKYHLAEPMIQKCVEESEKMNGGHHEVTLDYKANLADLLFDQEQYDRAEILYIECIAATKANISIANISPVQQQEQGQGLKGKQSTQQLYNVLVTLMSALANLYMCQGLFDEALPLYIERHNINKDRFNDEKDPVTLSSQHDLAVCYSYQGRYQQALPLYIECYENRKAVLGEGHEDTLSVINNLAILYHSLNDLKKAEKKHKECYNLRRHHLGADHPDTLASMMNLAKYYKDRENWSEAERYLRSVIEIKINKYGTTDADTLDTMTNLAVYYMDREYWSEAERYLRSIIEIKINKYGLTHASTLSSRRCLAKLYELQKNYESAEKLYKNCLFDCLKDKDNTKMIETIRAREYLAEFYVQQVKITEAKKEYLEALLAREIFFGYYHPDTIEALDLLSSFCVDIHNYDAAVRHTKDALDRRKSTLPYNHTYVLDTMSNLAKIYKLQNKMKEAGDLFKDSLRLEIEKSGGENVTPTPAVIPYAINLASYYRTKKKYQNAVNLCELCLNILLNFNINNDNNNINNNNNNNQERQQETNNLMLLQVKNNLANLRSDQGFFLDAESLYVECINNHMYASVHVITKLQYKVNLAVLYCTQPKVFPNKDGIQLLDSCITSGNLLLGGDHNLVKQWIATKESFLKKYNGISNNEYCILS